MLKRKSMRLPHYPYHHPGAYFVTLVTHCRQHLFGEMQNENLLANHLADAVNRHWQALALRFPGIQLDEFIIMPNHLHGIIWLTQCQPCSLSTLMALFKGSVSKEANRLHTIWQRGFYDRVIRNQDELDNIRTYIRNNPRQWHLDRLNHDENRISRRG